jgi:hypothetical protein
MTQVRNVRRSFLILLAAVAILTSSSAPPNQSELAARLAREWANANVARTAQALSRTATLGIPGLREIAALIIQGQIESRLYWTFSTPRPIGDSRHEYQVTATAIAPFDISVLNFQRRYTFSGSFDLRIDTNKLTVTESHMDAGSFRFSEIRP